MANIFEISLNIDEGPAYIPQRKAKKKRNMASKKHKDEIAEPEGTQKEGEPESGEESYYEYYEEEVEVTVEDGEEEGMQPSQLYVKR